MPRAAALRRATAVEDEARIRDLDALLPLLAHERQLAFGRGDRQALAVDRAGIGVGHAHRTLEAGARGLERRLEGETRVRKVSEACDVHVTRTHRERAQRRGLERL